MKRNLFLILALILVMLSAPFILRAPTFHDAFAQQTSTNEQKLQQLNTVLGENTLLMKDLLIDRYERRSSYDATRKAVDDSTQRLATQVEEFYGAGQKDKFITLWNQKINTLLQYADAKRAKDQEKATQSVNALISFVRDISTLVTGGNNNAISYNDAQNFFSYQVLNEKNILDAYINRDFNGMYDILHDAYLHAVSASAILAKNP